MKIGITQINELEEGLLVPKRIKYIENTNVNYEFGICDFNFETWEDFLDFNEFQEYTNFIIISNGERIIEVCRHLNKIGSNTIFSVFDLNLIHRFGEKFDLSGTSLDIEKNHKDDSKENLNYGSYTFVTGLYPKDISSDTIKHIFMENEEFLSLLSTKILLKSHINSAVIIERGIEKKISSPFIVLDNNYLDLAKYQSLDSECLRNSVLGFIDTGNIVPYKTEGVIDFASILENVSLNRLFITKGGIFSDYLLENKISDDISNINLSDIKNRLSLNSTNSDIKEEAVFIYNLVSTIGFYLKQEKMKVVSPYNNGQLSPVDVTSNQLIGLEFEDKQYIYNVETKKMYLTNESGLSLLEYYIKGRIHELGFNSNPLDQQVITDFLSFIDKISGKEN